MTVATINHIVLDDRGQARIAGTEKKVITLVMDKQAQGCSPEELHEWYPHLSLAAIHAAFAYFYDHQAEFDAQIRQELSEVEHLKERIRRRRLFPS